MLPRISTRSLQAGSSFGRSYVCSFGWNKLELVPVLDDAVLPLLVDLPEHGLHAASDLDLALVPVNDLTGDQGALVRFDQGDDVRDLVLEVVGGIVDGG